MSRPIGAILIKNNPKGEQTIQIIFNRVPSPMKKVHFHLRCYSHSFHHVNLFQSLLPFCQSWWVDTPPISFKFFLTSMTPSKKHLKVLFTCFSISYLIFFQNAIMFGLSQNMCVCSPILPYLLQHETADGDLVLPKAKIRYNQRGMKKIGF